MRSEADILPIFFVFLQIEYKYVLQVKCSIASKRAYTKKNGLHPNAGSLFVQVYILNAVAAADDDDFFVRQRNRDWEMGNGVRM